MNYSQYDYLGKAIKHPIQITNAGRPFYSEETKSVEQSILHILETPVGSWLPNPDYGSYLSEILHFPNNASTKNIVSAYVSDSIKRWETRVKNLYVNIISDEKSVLLCKIEYKIKDFKEVQSLVYPFYLNGI